MEAAKCTSHCDAVQKGGLFKSDAANDTFQHTCKSWTQNHSVSCCWAIEFLAFGLASLSSKTTKVKALKMVCSPALLSSKTMAKALKLVLHILDPCQMNLLIHETKHSSKQGLKLCFFGHHDLCSLFSVQCKSDQEDGQGW